jgi:hypothetical protein
LGYRQLEALARMALRVSSIFEQITGILLILRDVRLALAELFQHEHLVWFQTGIR